MLHTRLSIDKTISSISAETFQSKRESHHILKVLKKKKKKHHPRILYPAKLSFRVEGEISTLPDKQKLREFITTRLDLQEMLKVLLQA